MPELDAQFDEQQFMSATERRCCFFKSSALSHTIAEFRKEFAALPRLEKCDDCPCRAGASDAG